MSQPRPAPSLGELRPRRDETLRITAARGAREIMVFGSVARGDSRSGSDIDFVVEMDPDRTVLDLSELILDLEEALEHQVDVVELRRGSQSQWSEAILREAVPL